MRSMNPTGIQSFEEIRKGDYCYVDKTAQVYQLVKTGKYYFLSRPRRFGKSLLISTWWAYFQGKNFHGLAMETLEKGMDYVSCIASGFECTKIRYTGSVDSCAGGKSTVLGKSLWGFGE